MNKKLIFSILLIVLLILTSCAGNKKNVDANVNENTNAKIYVSNYPLYDFAKKIAGDKCEVINVSNNGGYHGWEPTAKDVQELENAKIFIYNGKGLESWADELIDNGTIKGKIIEASNGIEFLKVSEEEHEYEHEEGEHDHDHENALGVDPHIWLSLRNAKIMAKNIADGIVESDPDNADYYLENLDKFVSELDSMDREYTEKFGNTKRNTFVVSHEAFGYLCRDYALEQIGIEGINAEGEPSVKQIDEIIKLCKDLGIKTIFYENTISPKVSEVISNEVGAKLYMLSPLESLSEEQIKNDEDYSSIMKSNLKGIFDSLNE